MIEIKNVVKKYGDKFALNDISFTVSDGEIMGFLGPNGAGKTTTMNILTGYLSATSGTAKINGIDILENPMEAKKLIGFLPEQPPLYLDMTVKEYLDFVYNLKHCKLNRKKHIEEICSVVKITDVYKRMIKNLSKGYRQRVGIAQALIGNPKVLIFDEPTVGLDPKQIIDIRNLIRGLGSNHTIILSTHILPEVQAVCDRIVVINEGKIVANETTENIHNAVKTTARYNAKICGNKENVLKAIKAVPGVVYAELMTEHEGDSNSYLIEADSKIDIRKPLFYMLTEKGWPLVGLEDMSASLEEVFISLVDNNQANTPEKNPDSEHSDIQADQNDEKKEG